MHHVPHTTRPVTQASANPASNSHFAHESGNTCTGNIDYHHNQQLNSTKYTCATATLRWVKPSQGAIIEHYNLATNVKGIRYGGNVGDPIYAAADGQVVYAADGLKEYGNLVLIKHVDGYITAYAHNSKMNVSSGQNVTAGQKIAEMGSSGCNTYHVGVSGTSRWQTN